jgi:hypothetical protein
VDLLLLLPIGGVKLGKTGTLKTLIVLGMGATLRAPMFRTPRVANPVLRRPAFRKPLFPNPTFPNPKFPIPKLANPKLQPDVMCRAVSDSKIICGLPKNRNYYKVRR